MQLTKGRKKKKQRASLEVGKGKKNKINIFFNFLKFYYFKGLEIITNELTRLAYYNDST